MAPLVVAAIRSEIANSRDMMVEALYPITGRLVAAAVSNAFRALLETINARPRPAPVHKAVAAAPARFAHRAPARRNRARSRAASTRAAHSGAERDSGRLIARWPAESAPDCPG